MDLNLLVAFAALYRERNVTRAGRALGLSQPASSAVLAKLRAAFDDELFARTPHGLEPTEKAIELAEPITRALEELQSAIEPRAFDPKTSELVFRVGAVDAVVAVVLRSVAARMMEEAPHARLEISPCHPSNAVAQLDAREIDVALAPVDPIPAHIGSKGLFPIDLVLVARKDHLLAKKAEIGVSDLLQHPHVLVRFTGPVRGAMDEALAKVGGTRRVSVVLESFLAVPYVVGSSDAIALVPGPFGRRLAEEGLLVARELPAALAMPPLTMRLLWPAHADRSPASRWLRKLISDSTRSRA